MNEKLIEIFTEILRRATNNYELHLGLRKIIKNPELVHRINEAIDNDIEITRWLCRNINDLKAKQNTK